VRRPEGLARNQSGTRVSKKMRKEGEAMAGEVL
jgi:hypothetical protein